MGKQTESEKHDTDEEVPMEPLTPQSPGKPSDSVKKKPFSSAKTEESGRDSHRDSTLKVRR